MYWRSFEEIVLYCYEKLQDFSQIYLENVLILLGTDKDLFFQFPIFFKEKYMLPTYLFN